MCTGCDERGGGVFVYELALQLDLRSTDLVEAAHRAGLSGLTPSTDLTVDQVAQVRTALGYAPVAPVPVVPPPPLPAAPPPAWMPGPRPMLSARPAKTFFHRWMELRMLGFAITVPIIILVAVVSMVLKSPDDDGAACKVAGNTMCRNGSLVTGPKRTSAGFTFGSAGGSAQVIDKASFCAAQERIRAFWNGFDQQLHAEVPTSTTSDRITDWIRAQGQEADDDWLLLDGSLEYSIDADEVHDLEEQLDIMRRAADDGGSDASFGALRDRYRSSLDPAIAELARVGDAHC